MRITLFYVFFLSIGSVYAQKEITCVGDRCNTDFMATQHMEKPNHTSIKMRNNVDHYFIENQGEQTRELRLSTRQNQNKTINLSANLASQNSQSNTSDFVFIFDYINNLTLNLNGYVGRDGKSASEICAEEFYKPNGGAFGQVAANEFFNRRLYDPSIPSDKCVAIDVDYLLSTNFTCDEAGYEEISATNPVVTVARFKGKNKCIGFANMDVCLSRTVEVTCTWRIRYSGGPFDGHFSESTAYPDQMTRVFRMSEQEYDSLSLNQTLNQSRIKYLCENATFHQSTESTPVNIINNPNFYFNINGWVSNGIIWENEMMKQEGGLDAATKVSAEQSFTTIPGRQYRVQATFQKNLNNDYVSAGQVNVYSDIAKTNLIANQKVFETGYIKPVFLTSNSHKYHYGYSIINNISGIIRNVTITNKDDRTAVSCNLPRIIGPDASSFNILANGNTCGTNDLDPNQSCNFQVEARPTTVGPKLAYIVRDCFEPEFGITTTQLNEEIRVIAYDPFNYFNQTGYDTVNNAPIGAFHDGYFWRLDGVNNNNGSGGTWYRCIGGALPTERCVWATSVRDPSPNPTEIIKGVFYRGFHPDGMLAPDPRPIPEVRNLELVKQSEVPIVNRFQSKKIDFVFTATQTQSVIEVGNFARYHGGYWENVEVSLVSLFAGPEVKPPADLDCSNPLSTSGCLAGIAGNGYYDLDYSKTSAVLTSPTYDENLLIIPTGSDWKIRYVNVGAQCPVFHTKIASQRVATSLIAYDEVDATCAEASIPEDPAGKIVTWSYLTFERLEEFGKELIECRANNCMVSHTLTEQNRNLILVDTGSGSDGTQNGGGYVFGYDIVGSSDLQANNGSGGNIGLVDVQRTTQDRYCAKIQDANTENAQSPFAKEPVVRFKKYNWSPFQIEQRGNYGQTPANNGKKINVLKKMGPSALHFLQEELL